VFLALVFAPSKAAFVHGRQLGQYRLPDPALISSLIPVAAFARPTRLLVQTPQLAQIRLVGFGFSCVVPSAVASPAQRCRKSGQRRTSGSSDTPLRNGVWLPCMGWQAT
jgi:hypothetical protein